MANKGINSMLRQRMSASQQASDLKDGDAAYQKIFLHSPPSGGPTICKLPLDRLVPFFTADIGYTLYSTHQLQAFAQQLDAEGLLVRIIVRQIPLSDRYEILAGHNRVAAASLNGWTEIDAEIVEADDARAITIAVSTNLIQRSDLSIVARGKAYKALLEAKNRNGQRNAAKETFGDNRQRYSARALVAEFFGVTEYEIRKVVKLTQLIPELQTILEETPKKLNLACAALIADYDAESQKAFIEMCRIEGYKLNKSTMQHIVKACPPPSASQHLIFAAWREARAAAEKRGAAASLQKISFDRRRFAPYLSHFSNDKELEDLFLEFLRNRAG